MDMEIPNQDVPARVAKCFSVVFPELTPEEIPQASQASVAGWDSAAGITLMNVLEEEFGIEIDFDQAADLTSYELVTLYLKERYGVAAAS